MFRAQDPELNRLHDHYPTTDLARAQIARLEERYPSLTTEEQRQANRTDRMNLERLLLARAHGNPKK